MVCLICHVAGTIALIAGGAFALSKIDDGFTDFMRETSCKVGGGLFLPLASVTGLCHLYKQMLYDRDDS